MFFFTLYLHWGEWEEDRFNNNKADMERWSMKRNKTKNKASHNPNQCPICKKKIVAVIRKGKGGVDIRRESCCNITRVREVKREESTFVYGYDACKVYK